MKRNLEKKRKTLVAVSTLLAALMIFSLLPISALADNDAAGAEQPQVSEGAAVFADVSAEDWFYDAVQWAVEQGVTKGADDTHFSPYATCDRAQVVTFLWRAAGSPAANGDLPFSDVEQDVFYADAVRWAVAEKILQGKTEASFAPNDPVTREQLATFVYRYAQAKGEGFVGLWYFPLDFEDAASVSDWADESVHWCVMKGIVGGVGDNLLAPGDTANRGQIVTMLYRYLDKKVANVVYENGGKKLTVPGEYNDLLVTETPLAGDGIFFTVSEKASVEAAKAQGESGEGAGLLFSIGTVNENRLHEMLCGDMSGAEVFASDKDGNYYIFYHPTDVRFVRESYEDIEDDMAQWSALNEWAQTKVRSAFVAENGLIAESRGNSMLEMYLYRTAYQADTVYTLSTLDHGPLAPFGVDAKPYVDRLTKGLTLKTADPGETPDGEYVVLNFPDDVRFDFFLAPGNGENYIRQTWSDDLTALYKATYADGTTLTSAIAKEWYSALVKAHGLTPIPLPTADDLIGRWAEKMAGRGVITVEAGDKEGTYAIKIDWSNSAFDGEHWEMVGVAGNGAEIRYENGVHATRTYAEDGTYTEVVHYENGTGTFILNSVNEIMWQDDIDNVAEDCVFVSA